MEERINKYLSKFLKNLSYEKVFFWLEFEQLEYTITKEEVRQKIIIEVLVNDLYTIIIKDNKVDDIIFE